MTSLAGGATPRRAGAAQGVTIVVAAFLPIMAIVSLAPAIPSIIGHFATTPGVFTLVPLMVTAPGLLIAICAPGMGWLMDRYGRRPVMVWSTLAYGVLGLAPLFMRDLGPIFVSRLALGVCEAAIMTAANALLGDYFEPKRRRFWLTVQSVVGPFFATSVILTSGAVTERHWNGAFIIYVVAFPIFLAMLAFAFEPARVVQQVHEPDAPHTAFPSKTVAIFCAVTFFLSMIYYVGSVQTSVAIAATGVSSPKTLGVLYSIASLGVPFGAVVFGFLSSRVNQAMLLATVLALFAGGMIGVGLSRDYHWAVPLAMIQQVGAGMTVPTLVYWATGQLDVRHRGRGMGFWTAAFFLGQFLSPIVVGVVRGAVGGGILPAFFALGLVSAAGAIVAVLIGLRPRAAVASPALTRAG